MSRSVVIIGKGPSVLQSSKDFVDSFDDVAICNFPPIDGYEQYIGSRATHHFLNVHDPNPYSKETLNSLGLLEVFNTHPVEHLGFTNIFPDSGVYYHHDYGTKVIPSFREEYEFDPSAGILAFHYFVENKEYDTIGLVGFDFFSIGEKGYYYPKEKVQKSLRYLYGSGDRCVFDESGVRTKPNLHDGEKSKLFINEQCKKHNKRLVTIK